MKKIILLTIILIRFFESNAQIEYITNDKVFEKFILNKNFYTENDSLKWRVMIKTKTHIYDFWENLKKEKRGVLTSWTLAVNNVSTEIINHAYCYTKESLDSLIVNQLYANFKKEKPNILKTKRINGNYLHPPIPFEFYHFEKNTVTQKVVDNFDSVENILEIRNFIRELEKTTQAKDKLNNLINSIPFDCSSNDFYTWGCKAYTKKVHREKLKKKKRIEKFNKKAGNNA